MSPLPRILLALLAPALLAGAWPASLASEELTPDHCAALVRDAPDELESYRCYWSLARRGHWEEATRSLEALLQIDPGNHRARLYLAAVAGDRGELRAEALYREAAEGMRETGERIGEVYARLSLSHVLRLHGRTSEAGPELERALQAAEASGDMVLLARVQVNLANQAMSEADWGRALGLVRRAEETAFPDGPSDLRSHVLATQGRAYWGLGLFERALETYERQAEVDREAGDPFRESDPRFNMALVAGRLQVNGRMESAEYLRYLREALAVAQSSRNTGVEVAARLLLGQVLEGEEAREQYEMALAVTGRTGDRRREHEARRLLAVLLWRSFPESREEARTSLEDLIAESRARSEFEDLAADLSSRAFLCSLTEGREVWLSAYQEAFEAVEALRELQPEGSVRARVFSRWTFPYYRLAGTLLKGLPTSPDPEGDLDLALRTIERMRARVLAEELDLAGIPSSPRSIEADEGKGRTLLERITATQRELMDPALDPSRRDGLLAELERLEMEETAHQDAMARADPAFVRFQPSSPARVDTLRDRLGEDQALLSYHLALPSVVQGRIQDEGGSWLIVITRERARALPLPERDLLEAQVAVFLGLAARRDGAEARAGERLYEDLLEEAIDGLDPGIERLVIIPDGTLNRLPFAALHDPRSASPLGARFELSYLPSATLWFHWRGNASGGGPRSLALADPLAGEGTGGESLRAAHPWVAGLDLGPLLHARREVAALGRAMGEGSRVLVGSEASEAALKATDLGEFGVLHLAAHAVVDERRPERSGVLLAPGGAGEDGLLQAREIVELDLEGRLVILSGCRSVSGAHVSGEGVVGLARAFFRAGAHTVLGSLWPLRDDEAADLVTALSRELGRGHSVASALARAQRVRIDAGDPVAAWAGLVVLGDGDLVPRPGVPGTADSRSRWLGWILGALLLLGLVVSLRFLARR